MKFLTTILFGLFSLICAALGQALADFMGPSAAAPETAIVKRIGGQEVKLEFFRPAGLAPDEKRPAIVWIHGGAWVGGNTEATTPHARYFASRGLFAANIVYRLANPGKITVGDCLADCRAALRYLRVHAGALGLDPNRIAVAGDSAGGHLAAALGTLAGFDHADDDMAIPGRANAMLLYNPVVDMTEGEWIRHAVGGDVLSNKSAPRPSAPEDVALARSLSPLFHVAAGQVPAIVLHGRADAVVPVSQAERFAAASRGVGSRCDLVIYEENIGHAFVLAGYRWPEPVVVEAIRAGDRFLASLGWLDGTPSLTESDPPAWQTKLPAKESAEAASGPRSPVNQVFQFARSGTSPAWADGSTTKATAYLWIPEACRKLRGLLIFGTNVPEHMLVGHAAIREACAKNDLGIIWSVPTFWSFAKDAKGQEKVAVNFLQQLLDGLADASGYEEVATVPWLPIGESGHLLMVCGLIDVRPERCIAGICVKNPHYPENRTVPMLWTLGTAQEWGQTEKDIRGDWNSLGSYKGWVKGRAADKWPLSIVIEAGTGHFHCTDRMARYFAAYISAAVKARLSDDGSPTLKPLEMQQGVLAHLPLPSFENTGIAPCSAASGADLERPWFFDETTAREAQAMASVSWQADSQLPSFADGTHCAIKPFSFNSVTEIAVTTDAEFSLKARLLDRIPGGFQGAGGKLAVPPGDPVVEWTCGPVAPLGNGRFRIALDRTWKAGAACYLIARHDGDTKVRPGVQPAAVRLIENNAGAPQKITFKPIPDIKAGTPAIDLTASSDSGLPVDFFVVSGPAVIQGRRLVFTGIPPRAKFPIEVTVAAWQWGRPVEPKIRVAAIAKQTFHLVVTPQG